MNNRVNKAFPYDKEGVSVTSKLDELMMQYYRVPNGEEGGALHIEAFEVGQKLQYYFAVYSATIVNETMEGKKITLPDLSYAMKGLEAPLTLMLDNAFFQHNFPAIITSMLAEITRMATAREITQEENAIGYALSLCKWEYLTVIASLAAGTKAQREMDVDLRRTIVQDMDSALKSLRDHMKKE